MLQTYHLPQHTYPHNAKGFKETNDFDRRNGHVKKLSQAATWQSGSPKQ